MKTQGDVAPLLESFFARRLIAQHRASPNTLASYRDAFCLLLKYAEQRLKIPPSDLNLNALDAMFVGNFLDQLESDRENIPRTRNLRLSAIRSFFRYAALEAPQHGALIQRVLAIPRKRSARRIVDYLTHAEMEAILKVIDRQNWVGRRDYLSTAMELLHAGVDRSLIAIWLGHESVETTQIYLDANLALKREILDKTRPMNSGRASRYRPSDKLLRYLQSL